MKKQYRYGCNIQILIITRKKKILKKNQSFQQFQSLLTLKTKSHWQKTPRQLQDILRPNQKYRWNLVGNNFIIQRQAFKCKQNLLSIYQLFFLFENPMKRQSLKKDQLAKLYREFSRQKYNKYKHQYPRMRQTELVSKIIKEWENMELEDKENLFVQYSENKGLQDDKSESSEKKSPGSSKSKGKNKSKGKIVKGDSSDPKSSTPSKKSGVRVFRQSSSDKKAEKPKSESSDFARDGAKKDFQVSESDSKELGFNKLSKKKRITKDTKIPRTQYLKFFKFYYERLNVEHPKWTASEISGIIKLLWKKKIMQDKVRSRQSSKPHKELKKKSGRFTFRRNYGYNSLEAILRWKQLPKESKGYWKIKGTGLSMERKPVFKTIKLKNQHGLSTLVKSMKFLKQKMDTSNKKVTAMDK